MVLDTVDRNVPLHHLYLVPYISGGSHLTYFHPPNQFVKPTHCLELHVAQVSVLQPPLFNYKPLGSLLNVRSFDYHLSADTILKYSFHLLFPHLVLLSNYLLLLLALFSLRWLVIKCF